MQSYMVQGRDLNDHLGPFLVLWLLETDQWVLTNGQRRQQLLWLNKDDGNKNDNKANTWYLLGWRPVLSILYLCILTDLIFTINLWVDTIIIPILQIKRSVKSKV